VVKTVTACVVTALLVGAGTASAAKLITGGDIKNGTIQARDLAPSVKAKLNKNGQAGTPGKDGATGPMGPKGDKGNPGPAGRDAFTYVTSLGGAQDAWQTRESADCQTVAAPGQNPLARLDGHLVLGEFADGNALARAALRVPSGMQLRDIDALSYNERATGGTNGHNAPYVKLVTEDSTGGNHAVLYSPNTQPGGPGSTEEWRRHNITRGTVRYDDDAGNKPDITWAQMIAAHGDDTVTELRLQAGCAGAYSNGSTAYVDDVLLIGGGHIARYDFE
jgi:hypothetical protein